MWKCGGDGCGGEEVTAMWMQLPAAQPQDGYPYCIWEQARGSEECAAKVQLEVAQPWNSSSLISLSAGADTGKAFDLCELDPACGPYVADSCIRSLCISVYPVYIFPTVLVLLL